MSQNYRLCIKYMLHPVERAVYAVLWHMLTCSDSQTWTYYDHLHVCPHKHEEKAAFAKLSSSGEIPVFHFTG